VKFFDEENQHERASFALTNQNMKVRSFPGPYRASGERVSPFESPTISFPVSIALL
jgi:hypothetical protein